MTLPMLDRAFREIEAQREADRAAGEDRLLAAVSMRRQLDDRIAANREAAVRRLGWGKTLRPRHLRGQR